MGKVSLEGLEFFAYHGYYDEEQKIGNKYSVDISVYADLDEAAREDQLNETIDYEKLYKIITNEINRPSRLLEHIGKRIMDAVMEKFPMVKAVEVSVSKYNPPIGGVCHRAVVSLEQQRS